MIVSEAIEHTKNKGGMHVSFAGVCGRAGMKRGALNNGEKMMLTELAKHFEQNRAAWLEGDLETVAEFFGLYV